MSVWRRHRPVWMALIAVGAMSLACGSAEEEEPEMEFAFDFAAPNTVEVVNGDSLSKIAEREGCTVDELKEWNLLESDVIEVGQLLVVWNTGGDQKATPKDGSDRSPKVAAAPRAAPAPRPKPSSWNPLRALVGGSDEPEPEPMDDAVAVADVEEAEEAPEPRRPLLVRGAGVLGVDLGDDDGADLERAAAGMEKRGSDMDGSGLGNRGGALGAGGEADSFEVQGRDPGTYGGVMIPNTR